MPFQFGYLFLTLPFLLVWLLLFIWGSETRREQLLMSILLVPLGPLSELLYFRDYWLPESILPIHLGTFPLMIEDVLFAFAIGGIGSVIYEVLLRKHLTKTGPAMPYHIRPLVVAGLGVTAMFLLLSIGLNSIYASSLGFVVVALLILAQRRDLLGDAVGSGIGVMLVMFLSYFLIFNLASNTEEIFKQGWIIYGTALDVRLWGIPVTEMVWGFTWGLVAGPLYEFLKRMRLAG